MNHKNRKMMGYSGLIFAAVCGVNTISWFFPYLNDHAVWFYSIMGIVTPAASGFFAFCVFLYARTESKLQKK